jgi:hypothetical protein
MRDLAKVFTTSQPMLWAWIDGRVSPGQVDVQRLLEVRELFSKYFGEDVRMAHRVWRSNSRTGESLESLFSASFIDRDAVAEQMELLRTSIDNLRGIEERRRKRPFRDFAGRNGAIDDLPMATFDRD